MYFYSDMLLPEHTDRQVEGLVRLLEMQPPMAILDLACGFGRHANRLAALGFHVSGIDRSEGFLELARRDAAEQGVVVDYRQGDMRQLDFEAQFDRVLLLFTAFGYFDDQGNLDVLRRIARALKPGGRFIFDSIHRDSFLKRMLPAGVTEKDGNLMIDRNSFDSETGRRINRRIVIRDGIRRDKPFSVRLYNPNELQTLLPLAGLRPTGFFGDWDGTPLGAESRRMIVIAKKSLPGDEE
jgi:SAM-dependent methyltransferase